MERRAKFVDEKGDEHFIKEIVVKDLAHLVDDDDDPIQEIKIVLMDGRHLGISIPKNWFDEN